MRFRFIRLFLLLITRIGLGFASMAQTGTVTVSGMVTDANMGSIPGVNVYIEQTTIGVSSGIDGSYRIEVPSEIQKPVLVFSHIGYITRKVEIRAQTVIDVVLQEDVQKLGELVVIGYEVRRKADLTGAVSSVKVDELMSMPVGGLDQALQGRAAGVTITSNTGMPGEGVNVRIRGVGSINSSNAPLYIVDGVPTADALSVLHPNDIESVSILKDAASAAIYGSRANNGVVLITTRKGIKGKQRVEFNSQTGFQRPGNLTKMTNLEQYIEIYNEAPPTTMPLLRTHGFRENILNRLWLQV